MGLLSTALLSPALRASGNRQLVAISGHVVSLDPTRGILFLIGCRMKTITILIGLHKIYTFSLAKTLTGILCNHWSTRES